MSLKRPTPNQNDTFDVNLLKSFDICTNNVGGVWGAVLVHFLVRKLSTIITEHALLERERGKRKQQDGHTGHRAAKLSTTGGLNNHHHRKNQPKISVQKGDIQHASVMFI